MRRTRWLLALLPALLAAAWAGYVNHPQSHYQQQRIHFAWHGFRLPLPEDAPPLLHAIERSSQEEPPNYVALDPLWEAAGIDFPNGAAIDSLSYPPTH